MKSLISHIVSVLIVSSALASGHSVAAQSPASGSKSSNDALARARELHSLISSSDADKLSKIKKGLSDESWYVRGETARVLGSLAVADSAHLLLPLLEDQHWYVRECAMEALSALGFRGAADSIKPLLSSTDPYVRARAASTLGALKQEGAASSLIRMLADEDDHVRRSAALALGVLRESSASAALIPLLKDADPGVRRSAVVSLGLIGDRRAADAVLAAAREGEGVSWEYAAALYRLGNRDYYQPIVDALKSEYGDHRKGAFESLVGLGEARALPSLLDASKVNAGNGRADGESLSLRLMLARNLSRFTGNPAREAALTLIDDPSQEVRAAAAESLKRLGGVDDASAGGREIEIIIAALSKEKHPAVADAFIEVLALYDSARVADALLSTTRGKPVSNENLSKALEAVRITPERMITSLKTGTPKERSVAAYRLGQLGDAVAVDPLVASLSGDLDPAVKLNAAKSLGLLKDKRAVEALIILSASKDGDLRVAAVESLGSIADHSASDALFAAARDERADVRDAALKALARIGVSADRLTADLASNKWQVRVAAASMLGRLGDSGSVPALIGALRDEDSRVRIETARSLGRFGDGRAVSGLIGLLEDANSEVRVEATLALGQLKDSRVLPALARLLNERDMRVSFAAAESLARLEDARALGLLIDQLKSPDWRVRSRSTQVLARVVTDRPLDQTIKPLASCLADKDPVVRYYASEALIAMADRSVPAVIEFLKSPRESERQRAARVLWRIGAPAVEPLIAVVHDSGMASETRASAAHALGVIADKRATKPLLALLRDERYFVRQQAAWALGQMGESAVVNVVEMARSSAPATREAAIEALGNIRSSGSIDALIAALSDQNQNVRAAAVKALGETGDRRAVSYLVSILRDDSTSLRSQASTALARLGKVALPALVAALDDSKPAVRQFAAEALGKHGRTGSGRSARPFCEGQFRRRTARSHRSARKARRPRGGRGYSWRNARRVGGRKKESDWRAVADCGPSGD